MRSRPSFLLLLTALSFPQASAASNIPRILKKSKPEKSTQLDDYLKRDASLKKDDIYPIWLKGLQFKGQQYAMPFDPRPGSAAAIALDQPFRTIYG